MLFFFLTGLFLILNLLNWKVVMETPSPGPPSLGHMAFPRATAANRTTEAAVLVYNRVPKCSSTSMYMMLQALAARNNFSCPSPCPAPAWDIPNELRGPGKEEQVMSIIRALPKYSLYVRHIYNPDWGKYGVKVNLINMVRDPISRMASWFYFVRYTQPHQVPCSFCPGPRTWLL